MNSFTCPACQATLIVPDHYAGKKMICPSCQREIDVPGVALEKEKDAEESEEDGRACGIIPEGLAASPTGG